MRLDDWIVQLVIALGHLKQVICRALLMGQDERSNALGVDSAPVQSALHIGGNALLSSFEDNNAHPAKGFQLLLGALMQIPLRFVQLEGLNVALLGSDLQALCRKMTKVILELLPDGPLLLT